MGGFAIGRKEMPNPWGWSAFQLLNLIALMASLAVDCRSKVKVKSWAKANPRSFHGIFWFIGFRRFDLLLLRINFPEFVPCP
jgi:hypothetical protein